MDIVVPQFPFTVEDVAIAEEFRETLHALVSQIGSGDTGAWETELADVNFNACLQSYWVFLSGRKPASSPLQMLLDVIAISDEQFYARGRHGTTPF